MSRLAARRSAAVHSRPAVPTVNLLSPWSFEQMATRALRRRFVVAGLVLVLLVAAAWGGQHLRVRQAERLLAVEQAATSRLTGQTQDLAPVRSFVAGVEQQKVVVRQAMAREVYVSEVLDGLREATPVGALLSSVSITVAPAENAAGTGDAVDAGTLAEATCPGPDPFLTLTVVGCVTLSGTAPARADVGDLVVALEESRLFVEPFISTTTTGDAADVSFSGSVGLSPKVLSRRYAKLGRLLAEEETR